MSASNLSWVTITSWNEWHEGSQIEPAAGGVDNGAGFQYLDYGPLEAFHYLTATRRWVSGFEAMTWPELGVRETAMSILGAENVSDWLRQVEAGDGLTEPTQFDGMQCRVTIGNDFGPVRYIYFNVWNDFIYATPSEAIVTVQYFDLGTKRFRLEYDSTASTLPLEGRFKATSVVLLQDTGMWKTAIFELPDAYFGDRQQNGLSDFRIAVFDQDICIGNVTLSR